MLRKLFKLITICMLVLMNCTVVKTSFIYGEEDDGEDIYEVEDTDEKEIDDSVCNTNSDNYDAHACILYASNKYSGSIDKLQEEINSASDDFDEAAKLAEQYEKEADALQNDIDTLKTSIDELQTRISELEVQIADNEKLVEQLNTRVKNRMVESQKTMHFNGYLDFVLGSKSFTDLLRRIYGVNAILSKDKADRESYVEIINQLTSDKKEIEEAKAKLDEDYDSLVEKQAEFIVKKQFYQDIMDEIDARLEELQYEKDQVFESYSDLISETGLINSLGFVPAVHNSRITDTPWYYDDGFLGGATHLGVDYAATYGTEIHAPASGIVLRADQSCGYGSITNYCGAWIAGGGNQVYLMTSVNGSIYAFLFFHLSEIYVSKGDIVLADDVIGAVGSSGKSTGPHCHIEMYYLGDGTINEFLANSYSATFGVGRGEDAIAHRCEIGWPAPCILNPQGYLE